MSNSVFEPIYGRKPEVTQPEVIQLPPPVVKPSPPPVKVNPSQLGTFDWSSSNLIKIVVSIVLVVVIIYWLYLQKKKKDSLLKKLMKEVKLLKGR